MAENTENTTIEKDQVTSLPDLAANLATRSYESIMTKLENGETDFEAETKAMSEAIKMAVDMAKIDTDSDKLEIDKAKLGVESEKNEALDKRESEKLEFERARLEFEKEKFEFEKEKSLYDRERQERFDEAELDRLIFDNNYKKAQTIELNHRIKMDKANQVKDGIRIGLSIVTPLATFGGGLLGAYLMHKSKAKSQMDFMKLNALMQEKGIVTGVSNSKLIESQFNDLMKKDNF